MSNIYIVPTPIGNLGDITIRAIEVLKNVDRIYAEDTRVSKKLLNHYEIKTPVFSYHQYNEHKLADNIVNEVKKNKINVALISDAGTPGISDPGFLFINKAYHQGLNVFCLPGASALIPAVVQSGFSTEDFHFFGFLPHKKGRKKKLDLLLKIKSTVILYESPHRLLKLLYELKVADQDNREICVLRELTKLHEEIRKGKVEELIKYFENKSIKGEIVLVINKVSKKNNNE
tara:strand:- start:361 stop:1053 length:693 start_codon:yes stop_codon:yes gene_type:complete